METKRGLLTIVVCLTTALSGIAQGSDNNYNYVNPKSNQSITDKSNVVSFGFGCGGNYPYMGTVYVQNPNLAFSYDHTTLRNIGSGTISLGAIMAYENIYSGYTDNATGYSYDQHWNYYIFGARAIYHIAPFVANRHIETYAGVMLGYYVTKFSVSSTDPNYSEPGDPGYSLSYNNYPNFVAASAFVGVRSWFGKKNCVWLEVGYGYTSIEFGLSYKI